MKTVKVEALTVEKFLPFGYYSGMVNPKWEKLGAPPIEFYRDMLKLDIGGGNVAFSTLRVEKRPFVIDKSEYHNHTEEGILPLDNDIILHVAPATGGGVFPANKVRVFKVPAGTMLILRTGVWHHAPYTLNGKPANILIALPERLYNNDCVGYNLKPSEVMKIAVK